MSPPTAMTRYGDQYGHCEPYWYQGYHSPYYRDSHVQLRDVIRKFVDEEIAPNVDDWLAEGRGYPRELHKRAYELGIQGLIFPVEYGGTRPADFDAFHELILWDELARAGGGNVLGQLSINSMAMPPIIKYGSQYIKDKVVRDVVKGDKFCSLMISEPTAGSDVAAIRTTAVRDGDHFIVNGQKKWITGGLMADFFTAVVRTSDSKGVDAISLILLEKDMPGIKIRKMETQASNTHNTTFIILEDVRVPVKNLIGEEGKGFGYILLNLNHERWVIAAGAARASRVCYTEALHECQSRMTFGKKLFQHQILRQKLAEMARQVEALHDNLERVTYQFACGVADRELGAQCAFLKVQASKTFEFCAREAVQIFGGSGIVREGRGRVVERLYREVRGAAIPGGSEEILLDLGISIAVKTGLQNSHAKL